MSDAKRKLPEYLELHEVENLLQSAPHRRARVLMLLQWRAGLRVSEALSVRKEDLHIEGDRPTLRVRMGKGGKSRIVPVHPDLQAALYWLPVARRRSTPTVTTMPSASSSSTWRTHQPSTSMIC